MLKLNAILDCNKEKEQPGGDRAYVGWSTSRGDSHVEWFEGNFEDYEEDKKRRLGEDSILPKRIKYKKFARA